VLPPATFSANSFDDGDRVADRVSVDVLDTESDVVAPMSGTEVGDIGTSLDPSNQDDALAATLPVGNDPEVPSLPRVVDTLKLTETLRDGSTVAPGDSSALPTPHSKLP
jgi:hypothetical protein